MTDGGGYRWPETIPGLLLLLVVLATIALPVATLLRDTVAGLALGTQDVGVQFDDPQLRHAFINTLVIALASCALASVAAFALAAAIIRSVRAPAVPALLLMALPFVVPPFVTAALLGPGLDLIAARAVAAMPAAEVWLDRAGLRLIPVYGLHYFPLLTGTLLYRLGRLDRDQADAARTLGAGRLTVWRSILAPLVLPGLVLGACLMTLRIIGDAATPVLLGERALLAPVFLDRLGASTTMPPAPAALLLVALGSAVIVLGWNSLRPSVTPPDEPTTGTRRTAVGSSGMPRLLLLPLLIAGFAFSLLPVAALVATAVNGLLSPDATSAPVAGPLPVEPLLPNLQLTLIVAAASGIGLVIGAWLLLPLARRRSPVSRATRGLVTLILALPPVLLAAGWWQVGHDWPLAGVASWLVLVMIVVVQSLPLGLYMFERRRNTNADMLLAADRTLNAGRRLGRGALAAGGSTLPLMAVFLVGATALLTELNAALAMPRIGDRHFALQVYNSVAETGDWAFAALLLVLLGLGGAALGISAWHRRSARPGIPTATETWTGESQ